MLSSAIQRLSHPFAGRRTGELGSIVAALLAPGLVVALPQAGFAGGQAEGMPSQSCAARGFPGDARVIDVRRFGAKGDGVHDDTAALQTALSTAEVSAGVAASRGIIRVVYVPDGVYRVTDTLHWRSSYERYMVLQGQSRAGTIIKLDDSVPAFADGKAPRAVVSTLRSEADQRDSFRNAIYDLTVDAGRGNPGAVGIDYMSNNTGGIGDVTIRSSDTEGRGAAGLRLTQKAVGPALIKNVDIVGFDIGVAAAHDDFNAVFEHLTLARQRVLGIRNDGFILSIRDLESSNRVPVVENATGTGFVQIIGARLAGGVGTAVRSEAGFLHLRDVVVEGYATAIDDRGRTLAAGRIGEYASAPFQGEGGGSLRLPESEPPAVACDDPVAWTSIVAFGAVSGDSGKTTYEGAWTDAGDDAAAIQAAIDRGGATVYAPNGIWQIGRTLHIRGKVRRLAFLHSTLQLTADFARSGEPLFRFGEGEAPAVVIEQFETDYGQSRGAVIEHAAGRTLIVRQATVNLTTPAAYRTAAGGTGDVFFEDVTLNPVEIKGQRAWFRQFNAEGTGPAHLRNDGGQVWVLGMKTEGVAAMVDTVNGGKTEILGSLLSSTSWVPPEVAAFSVERGALSVVAATGTDPAAQQIVAVKDVKDGVSRKFRGSDFAPRAARVLYPWDGTHGPAGRFWIYSSR